MIKAISFDADGTLFGTFAGKDHGFESFFLEAARSHGVNVSLETLLPILTDMKKAVLARREAGFKPFVSEESNREHWLWLYEHVFTALSLSNPHHLAAEYIERYESGEFSSLYSDTIPCLEHFSQKKIPMIVISNFADVLLKFLSRFKIEHYFKSVIISGHCGFEKPEKEIFNLGAKALGLLPEQILHVGNDPDEDYHGALNADFNSVLLDRDSRYLNISTSKITTLSKLPRLYAI